MSILNNRLDAVRLQARDEHRNLRQFILRWAALGWNFGMVTGSLIALALGDWSAGLWIIGATLSLAAIWRKPRTITVRIHEIREGRDAPHRLY